MVVGEMPTHSHTASSNTVSLTGTFTVKQNERSSQGIVSSTGTAQILKILKVQMKMVHNIVLMLHIATI